MGALKAFYCGRPGKACDSLNVEYVVDRYGANRHVAGVPGSSHDKTAIEWSHEFLTFLNGLPEQMVILGDPAYRGLHRNVVTTFTGQGLTADQLAFNDECTILRQIVERSINATQIKWRFQQLKDNRFPAKYGVLYASKAVLSSAVLHNRFTNFL